MKESLKEVRIGILGLGTVGAGIVETLRRNQEEIARRAGQNLIIRGVTAKDKNKVRKCNLEGIPFYDSPEALIAADDIDIIVEVIGGCEVAKKLVLKALEQGKHVVTANKALIAEHGNELFAKAQQNNCIVAFEAAVAGGIPIIKTIREGLGGNRIQWLAGIINGTSNYILTKMRDEGCSFKVALQSAQEKGYAESDPTFDIAGIDAAHKLAILAAIAFGIPLKFSEVYIEGIQDLDVVDVAYTKELGYDIKHLGFATETEDGIQLRVHPTLIPQACLMAHVDGVMNAVLVQANAVGPTLYYGAGAGSEATASAILADLVDVARTINAPIEQRVPYLAFQSDSLSAKPICHIGQVSTAFYLRMLVQNKPGMLAKITRIMGDHDISIQSLLQKDKEEIEGFIPVVMITQKAIVSNMEQAIHEVEALPGIQGKVTAIKLEKLDRE